MTPVTYSQMVWKKNKTLYIEREQGMGRMIKKKPKKHKAHVANVSSWLISAKGTRKFSKLDCSFLVSFKLFPNKKPSKPFYDYHIHSWLSSAVTIWPEETNAAEQAVFKIALSSLCHQRLLFDLAHQEPSDCPLPPILREHKSSLLSTYMASSTSKA